MARNLESKPMFSTVFFKLTAVAVTGVALGAEGTGTLFVSLPLLCLSSARVPSSIFSL